MTTKELLETIQGGRVLDVATGRGQFVQDLIEELASYSEVIGVDVSDAGAAAFTEAFQAQPAVRFQQADALALPFEDETFDTVSISGSLHHFEDPLRPLAEIRRVLKTGGSSLVYELYRDHATKPEITHRQFHEWSETVLEVVHRQVYQRAEILALVQSAGFTVLRISDETQGEGDPRDPKTIARWESLIDQLLGRPGVSPALIAQGEAIRARLRAVGIHLGKAILVHGTKP